MREFFKGWKRKVGIPTLLMAGVFVVGWVRSLVVRDLLFISGGTCSRFFVESQGHSVGIGLEGGNVPLIQFSLPQWIIQAASGGTPLDNKQLFAWNQQKFGFGMGGKERLPTYHLAEWIIPYWAIVIPLTLLSARLLLSKSRKPSSVTRKEVS